LAEGDKKLRHIDGADDHPGLVSTGEESGGDHRAPTPSADGIEESSREGEGNGFGGFGGDGDRFMVGAVEDVSTHEDKIGADPRLKLFAREVGEEVGARDAADDAGKAEFQEEGFIDVLMEEMANATDPSSKNFGDFDRVADHGGGGAKGEEKGGAGDSVGHAESAIDDLADEADEDGDEEDWGHGEKSNRKRCSADLKKGDDAGGLTSFDHGVGAVVMDTFEVFGFDPVPLDIGVGIAFYGDGADEVFDENGIIVGPLGDMFFVGPFEEGVDF